MKHINAKGQCRGIEIAPSEWSGCSGGADCPSCHGSLPGDCQTEDVKKLRIILGPDLVDGDHWSPAPDYLQAAFDRYFAESGGIEVEDDRSGGWSIDVRVKYMTDKEVNALPDL